MLGIRNVNHPGAVSFSPVGCGKSDDHWSCGEMLVENCRNRQQTTGDSKDRTENRCGCQQRSANADEEDDSMDPRTDHGSADELIPLA